MSEQHGVKHIYKLPFGATTQSATRTSFRLWAPSASSSSLLLEGGQPQPMAQQADGWFALVADAAPGAAYKYRLPDGDVPDPASRGQAGDVHDFSLVVDGASYTWKHADWQGRPWHEAVIYELHAGAFGGFAGIEARLDELAELGITAIELMPVSDFPGARNWGYDGVLPFAPDAAYGTPDQLKSLIDAAHGKNIMVFLDVVYNHFGPDGAYLHGFAKPFFDPDVHTPWGAAIDFKRDDVRSFFINNALMWLREYRFDGLRFDAVHAISPQSFLLDLAAAIRGGVEPGRHVHLVLEHEGNRASLLRHGLGEPGFDAQWADDWHHCLHVLLTGESEGYYESFQTPAEQLARALSDGFVYQGEVSPHHGEPRGEPSGELPPTAFVICLQNHDQIGNRALGERLTQLADPDALAAATALLLLSPMIPMLFMGEEWGSKQPFLFFTSHNEELAPLVRDGRRKEFQHFAAFQDESRRDLIPDPNDEATFTRSIPPASEASLPEHAATRDLHRRLLRLRAEHVTPHSPGARSLGAAALSKAAVRAQWRLGNGTTLTIAANFGPEALDCALDGTVLFSNQSTTPGVLPGRCTVMSVSNA